MKNSKRFVKPVQILTGKYGLLLLTALNVCLACLIITLSNYWHGLDLFHTSTDYMTFFLPDFRLGFVSRVLVGSIIYLFTDHPTVRMVAVILYVTLFLSFSLFCWFQALIAKKALRTSDYATLLLSYLFFANKIFWCDLFQELGLLDIFMVVLVQVFLLCIERKRTLGYWLAPFICFIGLMIHTSFFFFGFPIVAAILWFELLRQGKPNRLCALFFTVSCVVSVALFILFTIFPQDLVRVGPEELTSMIKEKYDGTIQDKYFIYHMYRTDAVVNNDTIDAFDFLRAASVSRDIFSRAMLLQILNLLVLSVPFVSGCVLHARRSGNRLIAYLGFIAPLVTLYPSLLFSSDTERFFSLCILALYMLLHYTATQTDTSFLPCSAEPPRKKLSAYAALRREEKMRRALIVCAIAGVLFTVIGTQKL